MKRWWVPHESAVETSNGRMALLPEVSNQPPRQQLSCDCTPQLLLLLVKLLVGEFLQLCMGIRYGRIEYGGWGDLGSSAS